MTLQPIRLTATEHKILSILYELGEAYGLQIKKASNDAVARGSVYVLLGRMAKRGLVESRVAAMPKGSVGPRFRRLYKLTDDGRTALQAWN